MGTLVILNQVDIKSMPSRVTDPVVGNGKRRLLSCLRVDLLIAKTPPRFVHSCVTSRNAEQLRSGSQEAIDDFCTEFSFGSQKTVQRDLPNGERLRLNLTTMR